MTDTSKLRELLEKASPPPWTSSYFGEGQYVVHMPRERSLRFHPSPKNPGAHQSATVYGRPGIAHVIGGEKIVGVSGHELDDITEAQYERQRIDDGELIVALRNSAPSLLATLDAQAARIAELEKVLREAREHIAAPCLGGCGILETIDTALAPREKPKETT